MAELLTAMRPRALAVALKVLRNLEDAEDAVQDAFLKVWRCLDRFEGRSSFSTWIHRIVMNASLDLLRKNACRSDTPRHNHVQDEPSLDTAPAQEQTPEEVLDQAEVQALVRAAVAALPAMHRQVIELREFDDCSYQEVAEIVACPVGTVMSRLHHARHKLAEDLGDSARNSCQSYAA
jgi:RNA polymerase sigma-70 factor (ECF subfamily)